MYQFEKMDKKLLGDRIEDGLMRYILEEPVEVGQKIPNEFDLARRFGVGRSTIREAVKGLVSKGILEVRRGSGTYVVSTCLPDNDPLGLSKLQDKYKLALELFDVRLMLEPLHHPVPAASGNAGMKFNVFRNMVLPAAVQTFHFVPKLLQLPQVFFRGIFRRLRRNLRLQHQTHVKQLQCQLVLVLKL